MTLFAEASQTKNGKYHNNITTTLKILFDPQYLADSIIAKSIIHSDFSKLINWDGFVSLLFFVSLVYLKDSIEIMMMY